MSDEDEVRQPAFGFRVIFEVSPSMRIRCEEASYQLPFRGVSATLRSRDDDAAIEDAARLEIYADGLESRERARRLARKVNASLPIAGLACGLGIQPGRGVERLESIGEDHSDDPGSMPWGVVFDDSRSLGTVLVEETERTYTVEPDAFGEELAALVNLPGEIALSSEVSTALALYTSAHFSATAEARFLSLFNALEVLAPPQKRSDAEIAHIEELLAATAASDLPEASREALGQGLNNLRSHSQAHSCRLLIASTLGPGSGARFGRLIPLRHRAAHGAGIPADVADELDRLVARTIVRQARVAAVASQ